MSTGGLKKMYINEFELDTLVKIVLHSRKLDKLLQVYRVQRLTFLLVLAGFVGFEAG